MFKQILTSAALVLALVACASDQTVDNFDSVHQGMDMDTVHETIGTPSSSWQMNQQEHGFDGQRQQWGDNASSIATSAMYRDSTPERVYSVTFDKNGQVVSKSYPLWAQPKSND